MGHKLTHTQCMEWEDWVVGPEISLFFSLLSSDRVENDEVKPIVYTQHLDTFLCVPLYTPS